MAGHFGPNPLGGYLRMTVNLGPPYALLRFCRLLTRSSTTAGSASVDVSPRLPYSSSAILRKIRRMILPDRVFFRLHVRVARAILAPQVTNTWIVCSG